MNLYITVTSGYKRKATSRGIIWKVEVSSARGPIKYVAAPPTSSGKLESEVRQEVMKATGVAECLHRTS